MTGVEAWVLPRSAAVDLGCLTPAERAHAGSMGAPGAAARHLRGRAALRHAVAAVTGLEAGAVPLSPAGCGRPVVEVVGGPRVSVAHTGEVVAVALCGDSPVGIDVEVAGARWRPVPAAVLTDERCRAVAPLVDEALAPLAVWVVLEAALKAAGTGFAQPQRAARLAGVPDGVVVRLASGGSHACRLRVQPGGTVAAVATQGAMPQVRWHDALVDGVERHPTPPRAHARLMQRR